MAEGSTIVSSAQTVLAVSTTLAAQVLQNGTFNIAYPTGFSQSSFTNVGQNGHKAVPGLGGSGSPYYAPTDFTVSFGAGNITVTWLNAATLAAGTVLNFEFNKAELIESVQPQPTVAQVTPATVTTTQLGTALNAVIAALQTAGILAP